MSTDEYITYITTILPNSNTFTDPIIRKPAHLIFLQSFDGFLINLDDFHAGSWVGLVAEFLSRPRVFQICQDLLKCIFLHRFVDDIFNIFFKLVQIEIEKFFEGCLILNVELDLKSSDSNEFLKNRTLQENKLFIDYKNTLVASISCFQ